jgi:hypothetical protein
LQVGAEFLVTVQVRLALVVPSVISATRVFAPAKNEVELIRVKGLVCPEIVTPLSFQVIAQLELERAIPNEVFVPALDATRTVAPEGKLESIEQVSGAPGDGDGSASTSPRMSSKLS